MLSLIVTHSCTYTITVYYTVAHTHCENTATQKHHDPATQKVSHSHPQPVIESHSHNLAGYGWSSQLQPLHTTTYPEGNAVPQASHAHTVSHSVDSHSLDTRQPHALSHLEPHTILRHRELYITTKPTTKTHAFQTQS